MVLAHISQWSPQSRNSVERIFCGADPDHFVGPDNGYRVGRDIENNMHAALSLQAIQQLWANDFASNNFLRDYVCKLRPRWTTPFVFRRQLFRTNMPNCAETSTGIHYDHRRSANCPHSFGTHWRLLARTGRSHVSAGFVEDWGRNGDRFYQNGQGNQLG